MKKLLSIITVIIFLTSCSKEDVKDVMDNVSVQVQIGPVLLSWGGTGAYGMYYGTVPSYQQYGVDDFVGYIISKPTDQNHIPIYTASGVFMCTASCSSMWWPQANNFWLTSQSATYQNRRPVWIHRVRNTLTTNPDEFYITGY